MEAHETGVQHDSGHDPSFVILPRGTSRRKQHCPRKAPCESFVCIIPEQPIAGTEQHAQQPAPARPKARKPSPCAPKEPKMELQGPCTHCATTYSPQWRRGPVDKPVLCNACGLRYGRTGSLDLTAPRRSSTAARPKRAPLAAPGAVASAAGEGSAGSSQQQQEQGSGLWGPPRALAGLARPGSPDSATSEQAAMAPRRPAEGSGQYQPYTSMQQEVGRGRGLRHKKPSQRLMEGLQVLLAGEEFLEGPASDGGDAGWWRPAQAGADQGGAGQLGSALGLPQQQLADLTLPSSASQQAPHALGHAAGDGACAEQAAGSGSWGDEQMEDAAWMLTVPGAIRKRPRNWVPLASAAAAEPCNSHTSGSSGYGPPLFKAAPAIVAPLAGLHHGGGGDSTQHYPVLEVAPLHYTLSTAQVGPSSCSTYLPTSSSCVQGFSGLPHYDYSSPASSSWGEYGYASDSHSSQNSSSESSEGSTRMVKRCRTAGPSRLRASSS